MKCHNKHEWKRKDIDLKGENESLPDAPRFIERLKFKLNIYDYPKYSGTGDCPGDDGVSFSIDEQGVWEPFETLLLIDILKQESGVVVDFGSQLGWFSLVSALKGNKVVAYDGVEDNIDLLKANASLNGIGSKIEPHLLWIDEKVKTMPPQDILFMKIDIEGNEQFAIKMYEESLKTKRVKYLLIEVSPQFNDSYPALTEKLMGYGYTPYQIPQKRQGNTEEFAKDPLKVTLKYPVDAPSKYLKTINQENWLFV